MNRWISVNGGKSKTRQPIRTTAVGRDRPMPSAHMTNAFLARIATLAFLGILFFVPKANIFYPTSSYVGVKPDDLAFGALLVVTALLVCLNRLRDKVSWTFLILAFLYLGVALIAGGASNASTRAMYVYRYASYLACLPIGVILAQRLKPKDTIHLARLYTVASIATSVLIILQDQGIIGGFLNGTWTADVAARPVGQMSHPTEAAAVLLVVTGVAIALHHATTRVWRLHAITVIALAAAAVIITEARSTILAVALTIVVMWAFSGPVVRRIFTWSVFVLLLTTLSIGALPVDAFQESESRILQLLHPDSIVPAFAIFTDDSASYQSRPEGVDPSLYIRLLKWRDALERFAMSPVWGQGAGALGPAVDGIYVRLLAETGLLGLIAFVGLLGIVYQRFRRATPSSRGVGGVILATLLIGLVIDIFYFARFAYVFWFSLGLLIGMDRARERGVGKSILISEKEPSPTNLELESEKS
ncbi:MAG: O-antigen ligase family protein [Trueperaceae bacterium]